MTNLLNNDLPQLYTNKLGQWLSVSSKQMIKFKVTSLNIRIRFNQSLSSAYATFLKRRQRTPLLVCKKYGINIYYFPSTPKISAC